MMRIRHFVCAMLFATSINATTIAEHCALASNAVQLLKLTTGATTDIMTINAALTNADYEVARMVAALIRRHTNMVRVASKAEGCVKFHEMCPERHSDPRAEYNEAASDIPLVYYRCSTQSNGSTVIVCENSFPGRPDSWGRFFPSVYSVTSSESGADIAWFKEIRGNQIPAARRMYKELPVVVDIFASSNLPPRVAILYGPDGTGHFAHLHMFTLVPDSAMWTFSNAYQVAGVRAYRYDATGKTFFFDIYEDSRIKHLMIDLKEAALKDAARHEWIRAREVTVATPP